MSVDVSAWSGRDRLAVVAGLLLPLGVAAALVWFRSSFPNTDSALVLVVVVVGVAANGNRLAGVLASVSAAVWFDFFLTRPYERLVITHRDDIETTVLLMLVGVTVTELAVRGRRQRALAVTDEAYLAAIARSTELATTASSTSDIVTYVRGQLIALLDLRDCRFERSRFGGLPRLDADGRLRWRETSWDLDQYGMPTSSVELLAEANGRAYARFVLDPKPGSVPPLPARRMASILAGQVGVVLAGSFTPQAEPHRSASFNQR